ncbi:MAG: holin family protein [Gammaproteobacteria bacterium]|nr:holin family protein [Gammaproteobacteria bacterium]
MKLSILDPEAAVNAVGTALDKLFTSDDERNQAAAIMERLRQAPGALQVELNKVEAGHRSRFVAGWRPFIGWVCGLGLANTFLVNPWIQWVTGQAGPTLPIDVMAELVIAMLGLSGLRTYEKLKGAS